MRWLWNFIRRKGHATMPQSREEIERRELEDRLIEEHRRANAAARELLQEEAPRMASRYLSAMDHAMAIMRGD